MIIIEIALGIVLAVLILNFLPELIAFGGIVIIIGIALICAVLLFYWVDNNLAAIGSVLLVALVAGLYRLWKKNFAEDASVSELKELIHRRQLLGYDTSDLSVELKNAISASIKTKNNNVIKCGYSKSNELTLQEIENRGNDGIVYNHVKKITPVDYTNLEKIIPGFTFLKEPCDPCKGLHNPPNYHCPFELNIRGEKKGVSPIWNYLWNFN